MSARSKIAKASADAFKDALLLNEAAWYPKNGDPTNVGELFTKATAAADVSSKMGGWVKADKLDHDWGVKSSVAPRPTWRTEALRKI